MPGTRTTKTISKTATGGSHSNTVTFNTSSVLSGLSQRMFLYGSRRYVKMAGSITIKNDSNSTQTVSCYCDTGTYSYMHATDFPITSGQSRTITFNSPTQGLVAANAKTTIMVLGGTLCYPQSYNLTFQIAVSFPTIKKGDTISAVDDAMTFLKNCQCITNCTQGAILKNVQATGFATRVVSVTGDTIQASFLEPIYSSLVSDFW